jgi:SAM-dependent methyltransferase
MPYRRYFEEKFREYLGADLEGNAAADVIISPEGRLPIEDQSVDCVLSSQVLEHVADPAGYLAEAFRVLHPGGSLILSTHGLWRYHPDPTDFWRWTKDGLVLQVERAGFRVERIAGVFGLLASALQLLQDGIARSLPRWCRGLPNIVVQPLIGLIERGRDRQVRPDASVYLVLAKKPAAPEC